MTLSADLKDYVKQYYLDRYGFAPDLETEPWHKIVGYSWEANTYYKKGNFYGSLEDVADPVEGMTVYIFIDQTRIELYFWSKGKWAHNSEVTIDMYKE